MPTALNHHLAMALDPAILMRAAGFTPDPWQARILRSTSERTLVTCHRQAGKSTAVAGSALHTALYHAPGLVLMVSASQRQANEVFKKTVDFYGAIGKPVDAVQDSAQSLELANGSRIVSLPASPDRVRGYSAPKLVIIDEAAQVADEMLAALIPMLTISRGRLLALSTPFGRRGWYFAAWEDPSDAWEKISFKASENPRLDPADLAEQRKILGDRWYMQEFELEFVEAIGQAFSTESVLAAFNSQEPPLF